MMPQQHAQYTSIPSNDDERCCGIERHCAECLLGIVVVVVPLVCLYFFTDIFDGIIEIKV